MGTYFDLFATRYPALKHLLPQMNAAADMLSACYRRQGRILICGNGGSAADAEHIAGELMKGFIHPRPLTTKEISALKLVNADDALINSLQRPISAISLVSGISLPTAFANDVNPKFVFAQQVLGLGRPGDVLIGISTSGKSVNIIEALRVGKAFGLYTIGLTRHGGTPMDALCDITIGVPAESTPEIQEYHLPIYHALCEEVENRIFGYT